MFDFTPQFIELFAQLFWNAIYLSLIFFIVRVIAFFLMPWKIYN